MKYLKKYKVFEAIIIPKKIESNLTINSFDDLVEYGKQNEFDVVDYDDFYNSLTDVDKKNAPPKVGVPFFALFHPERKVPMFVLNDEKIIQRIPDFKEIVDDIIGHEKIHKEQSIRKGDVEYSLPSPNNKKAYFSNKEEIMAFSWTIANDLSKTNNDIKSAFDDLDTFGRTQAKQIWSDIKRVCDKDVIRRYQKYIYMYLEDIFNQDN